MSAVRIGALLPEHAGRFWRSTRPGSTRATPPSRRGPRSGRRSTRPSCPATGSSPSAPTGGCWVGGGERVSDRCAYAGVVEHSVYVHPGARGRGVARGLLEALIASTEAAGIWTIQSGIFPENTASLTLHERAGFRVIGTRERIGRHHGAWRDVVLLERRSTVVM